MKIEIYPMLFPFYQDDVHTAEDGLKKHVDNIEECLKTADGLGYHLVMKGFINVGIKKSRFVQLCVPSLKATIIPG
jgi:hypothetical protein